MIDEISTNARAFSAQLVQLSALTGIEISQVIRKAVLDLFKEIILRSPVDTGAYRASHTIANHEPSEEEGVVKGKKGETIPATTAFAKGEAWTWKVGDGDIFIFNNQPYAERIENGWSNFGGHGKSVVKAPRGVYSVSLSEMGAKLNHAIITARTIVPISGEEGEK